MKAETLPSLTANTLIRLAYAPPSFSLSFCFIIYLFVCFPYIQMSSSQLGPGLALRFIVWPLLEQLSKPAPSLHLVHALVHIAAEVGEGVTQRHYLPALQNLLQRALKQTAIGDSRQLPPLFSLIQGVLRVSCLCCVCHVSGACVWRVRCTAVRVVRQPVNTNQSYPTQLVDQVLSADTVMQEFVVGGGSVHLAAILSLPQVNLCSLFIF